MPGTLYIVSTPIGNLGDMTDRAREVLASVDLIACEDTRVTGKLLEHLGIAGRRKLSYHEHNEAQRAEEILDRLREGLDVALVSDAGTPVVSDPGYRLVRAARAGGIEVRAVPGASALLAALAVSGLPSSTFTFAGFLPARGSARRRAIERLGGLEQTVVLFESPTRAAALLGELADAWGEREACLLREMTKLHEEHRSGDLRELATWARDQRFKGELTLVVGPPGKQPPTVKPSDLREQYEKLRDSGLSARDAAKRLSREHGLSARSVYNELSRHE
jgi:16S rRNA (cytidine1402-2'-O)-methyltransferase